MKSPRVKPSKKYIRVNTTLPPGLYAEAQKLVEKYHFEGMSELFQHFIREAVFNPNRTHPSALLLNDAARRDDESPN